MAGKSLRLGSRFAGKSLRWESASLGSRFAGKTASPGKSLRWEDGFAWEVAFGWEVASLGKGRVWLRVRSWVLEFTGHMLSGSEVRVCVRLLTTRRDQWHRVVLAGFSFEDWVLRHVIGDGDATYAAVGWEVAFGSEDGLRLGGRSAGKTLRWEDAPVKSLRWDHALLAGRNF